MKRAQVHSYARPDRDYLRGRLNRSVRRARFRKLAFRWSLVLSAHVVLAAGLGWSGARMIRALETSPRFGLQRIQVVGARMSPRDEIARDLESLRGQNVLSLDLRAVAARVEAHRWVLRASVKRLLPRGLRIELTERTPMALARVDGSVRVVDETGAEIGLADPGAGLDLPVLKGLDRLQGEPLRRALARGADVLRRLRRAQPEWAGEISEIRLARADRIEIVTSGAGPRVWLDPEEVERNLGAYLALRAELDSRVTAVDYVDLRWKDRISVKPLNETSLNRPATGGRNRGA